MAHNKKSPVYLVRGSINLDEFFQVPHVVNPGETISSTGYSTHPGGKGANQAVALAASGATVDFAGSVGSDGEWLKEILAQKGVGTDLMLVREDWPSGRAIIQTTPEGENAIFVYPGANHSPYSADKLPLQPHHTHLLLQNEIRLSDTTDILRAAYREGIVSIFNPSPMLSPDDLRAFPWAELSVLVVNEGEAKTLVDALGEQRNQSAFQKMDVLDALLAVPMLSSLLGIVVTLGGDGVVASFSTKADREIFKLPAAKVQVVDTTGAGDTFLGYFCGSLAHAHDIESMPSLVKEALQMGIVAAGLSTEKAGAMGGIPSKAEVDARFASYLAESKA